MVDASLIMVDFPAFPSWGEQSSPSLPNGYFSSRPLGLRFAGDCALGSLALGLAIMGRNKKTAAKKDVDMERDGHGRNTTKPTSRRWSIWLPEYYRLHLDNKTEREVRLRPSRWRKRHGYRPLDQAVREGRAKAGDRVVGAGAGKGSSWRTSGQRPLEHRLNILGVHRQPASDLPSRTPAVRVERVHAVRHAYYGRASRTTSGSAATAGAARRDREERRHRGGRQSVSDDPDDPVFCVTDLLIHLAGKQMAKKANEVVEGEDLDIPMGNRPFDLRGGPTAPKSLGSP